VSVMVVWVCVWTHMDLLWCLGWLQKE
jgi:hypothetical protein